MIDQTFEKLFSLAEEEENLLVRNNSLDKRIFQKKKKKNPCRDKHVIFLFFFLSNAGRVNSFLLKSPRRLLKPLNVSKFHAFIKRSTELSQKIR